MPPFCETRGNNTLCMFLVPLKKNKKQKNRNDKPEMRLVNYRG